MNEFVLSVREIQAKDIDAISDYWLNSDRAFLEGMGVDVKKIPARDELIRMLSEQLSQPYQEKKAYCTIWEMNGKAIGHCNVNKIIFGKEAFMHLHLWKADARQKGMGTTLVKKSLPYFFRNLQLKKLFCEPYSLNPSPNKTLEKSGFVFVKQYVTVPGWINFEQPVNLWEMSDEQFARLT